MRLEEGGNPLAPQRVVDGESLSLGSQQRARLSSSACRRSGAASRGRALPCDPVASAFRLASVHHAPAAYKVDPSALTVEQPTDMATAFVPGGRRVHDFLVRLGLWETRRISQEARKLCSTVSKPGRSSALGLTGLADAARRASQAGGDGSRP